MKHIWLAIILAAFTGNIALADGVDFTGEWFVESEAVGSGNVVTIQGGKIVPTGISARPTSKPNVFTIIPSGTFFDFTANGSKLTGYILRYETEEPIYDGKINGNKITFTVRETAAGKSRQPINYYYTGKLSDDGIQFEAFTPSQTNSLAARFQFTARRIE